MPKRNLKRQIYREEKRKKKLFFFLRLGLFAFCFFIFMGLAAFIFYAKDLPRPEKFTEKQVIQSTKIYDRTGQVLLYEIYGEEKRTLVPLETIPQYLKDAVIATEDADFYNHLGIDFKGILRSVLINLKLQKPSVGGSTIPQQLIRSTFFTTEKTAERKTREIVLALELDRRYSKDQILGWYLNQVPFGSNAYGAEAASQTFFNKPVSEASLEEAAVLAALIQAPSYYSPFGDNLEDLLARKDYVLDRMAQAGYIRENEALEAKTKEIAFVESPVQIKAPYFTLWIKSQLIEKYGEEFLRKNGLRVYTSLDWTIQQEAERALKEGVERNAAFNARNGGLVAIDPNKGEVLAMSVGTGNYYAEPFPEGCQTGVDCLFDPKFNVAVGTKNNPGRQPGSAFKPFVYVTAFKKGANASTTIVDEETNFGLWGGDDYIPQNYDGKFRGEITLRNSLAQSINVPAVKVLLEIADSPEIFRSGNDPDSIKTAKDFGLTTLNPPYGPSIVLGGWEVKLIEMVSAYGVFAAEGMRTPIVSILKIEDSNGNVLEENKKSARRVIEKEPVVIINDILSDNEARAPMFGSNSNLYFKDYEVAAKTGTTQDYKDAWAIGYTPSIVAGVWVGNNNGASMTQKPAVSLAGPLFHDFLSSVLPLLPQKEFTKIDQP